MTESTTNLLLAAYLITGGATVISLETSGKYTRIHLDLSTVSKDSLVGHARSLAALASNAVPSDTIAPWEELFDFSLLSRVDREYQQLKRLIAGRRAQR